MLMTSDKIKNLNPCNDRWENFNANYPNFNGTLEEFLNLDLITYNDKLWVSIGLMTKQQSIKFSLKCIESVLHIYENEYPNDKKPRELLEYLKSIPDFGNMTEVQKVKLLRLKKAVDASIAAAYATFAAKALDVAYNVAAVHAAYYAAYAAKTAAAVLAAYNAANYAVVAGENQQDLNLLFMQQVLETK